MYTIAEGDCFCIFEDLSVIHVCCFGKWQHTHTDVLERLDCANNVKQVVLDAKDLESVTSEFLAFVQQLRAYVVAKKFSFVTANLPENARHIFNLQQTQMPQAHQTIQSESFFYKVGELALDGVHHLIDVFKFFSTVLRSIADAVLHHRKGFWDRVVPFLQTTGVEALPIVTLISALVGLIMAFVSVVQLERFGASIYVADLVALAMTREMGCLMIGVIIAGRTGAAFAATIGSMQVNEELDALQTFGINKVIYLIAPRVLALALMMPLLCIFADLIGIIGGMISSLPFINGSVTQYILQTEKALAVSDILIGLTKSFFFGIIIAGIGCFYGVKCGRNAEAVGQASTQAVVQGITWIIVADAIFAVITTALGF